MTKRTKNKIKARGTKGSGSRMVSAATLENVTRIDAFKINPMEIEIDTLFNFNPRTDLYDTKEEWDELKQSILTNGIQSPLELYRRGDTMYLAHGFRRLQAVKELIDEGHDIPFIPFLEVPANDENLIIRHFILNTGKPLKAIEKARGLEHLKTAFHMSLTEISRKTSIPVPTIIQLIDLIKKTGAAVQDAVTKKEISVITAKTLIKISPTVAKQAEILDEIRELAKEDAEKEAEEAAKQPVKVKRKPRVTNTTPEATDAPEGAEKDTPEPTTTSESPEAAHEPEVAPEPAPIRIRKAHVEKIQEKYAPETLPFEMKVIVMCNKALALEGVNKEVAERIINIITFVNEGGFTSDPVKLLEMFGAVETENI